MNSRDKILQRIREALQIKAGAPHLAADEHDLTPPPAGKEWLPDGGDNLNHSLQILTAQLEKLKTNLVRVPNVAEAAQALQQLIQTKQWQRVAYHGHPHVAPLVSNLPCETWQADLAADKQKLESCDASITSCEAIVAQLGSILVSSQTSGGRALSILPHAHVVVAYTHQIVPDLADAMQYIRQQHGAHLPSMLSFITGPSRTGDIERILVLGAHGPKELFLVLIDG